MERAERFNQWSWLPQASYDSKIVRKMLEEVRDPIAFIAGNGMYDLWEVYEPLREHKEGGEDSDFSLLGEMAVCWGRGRTKGHLVLCEKNLAADSRARSAFVGSAAPGITFAPRRRLSFCS